MHTESKETSHRGQCISVDMNSEVYSQFIRNRYLNFRTKNGVRMDLEKKNEFRK